MEQNERSQIANDYLNEFGLNLDDLSDNETFSNTNTQEEIIGWCDEKMKEDGFISDVEEEETNEIEEDIDPEDDDE